MYPMLFMERFWRGEPKKELFVAMPFPDDGSFEPRYKDIEAVASDHELKAVRSKDLIGGGAIFTDILRGIANSKLVLCDLSDDPRRPEGYANGNVLHEAGIAMTIREEHEVILIREQKADSLMDFDIKFQRIQSPHPKKITKDWLAQAIDDTLKEIDLAKSERIRVMAETLDASCLYLIKNFGSKPREGGENNFALQGEFAQIQYLLAVHRLMDLGVLRIATAKIGANEYQYSYRWTSLLGPLVEHLKFVHKMPKYF